MSGCLRILVHVKQMVYMYTIVYIYIYIYETRRIARYSMILVHGRITRTCREIGKHW